MSYAMLQIRVLCAHLFQSGWCYCEKEILFTSGKTRTFSFSQVYLFDRLLCFKQSISMTTWQTQRKILVRKMKNLEKPCLFFKLNSNKVKAYFWKKPLTQYYTFSITFICRLCTMLFSWILLVTLVGIYAINNNKSVHSKSTTIVPKTKRILRSYPKQMNLNTVDKFKQNIISK